MTKRDLHVAPSLDGKWAVRATGAEKASKKFDSRDKALEHARNLAVHSNTGVFIHGQDGRVMSKDTYPASGAASKGKNKAAARHSHDPASSKKGK